jgi:hypothetical protein
MFGEGAVGLTGDEVGRGFHDEAKVVGREAAREGKCSSVKGKWR